jgi:hypothetical protein
MTSNLPADPRVERARMVLAAYDKNTGRWTGEVNLVGQLAAVLRGVLAVVGEDAGTVAAVRAVLASFDWELDDRQVALEAIDTIVNGVL